MITFLHSCQYYVFSTRSYLYFPELISVDLNFIRFAWIISGVEPFLECFAKGTLAKLDQSNNKYFLLRTILATIVSFEYTLTSQLIICTLLANDSFRHLTVPPKMLLYHRDWNLRVKEIKINIYKLVFQVCQSPVNLSNIAEVGGPILPDGFFWVYSSIPYFTHNATDVDRQSFKVKH